MNIAKEQEILINQVDFAKTSLQIIQTLHLRESISAEDLISTDI